MLSLHNVGFYETDTTLLLLQKPTLRYCFYRNRHYVIASTETDTMLLLLRKPTLRYCPLTDPNDGSAICILISAHSPYPYTYNSIYVGILPGGM